MKKGNVKNESLKLLRKVKFGKWPEKPERVTHSEESILMKCFILGDNQMREFLNENYIEIDRYRLYFEWNGELVSTDGPVLYGHLANNDEGKRRSINGYFLVYEDRVYQCLNVIEANSISGLIQKEYECNMYKTFELKETSRRLQFLESVLSGTNIKNEHFVGSV